jgi:hypothetical protein
MVTVNEDLAAFLAAVRALHSSDPAIRRAAIAVLLHLARGESSVQIDAECAVTEAFGPSLWKSVTPTVVLAYGYGRSSRRHARGTDGTMRIWPVDRSVGTPRNNGPELLKPPAGEEASVLIFTLGDDEHRSPGQWA